MAKFGLFLFVGCCLASFTQGWMGTITRSRSSSRQQSVSSTRRSEKNDIATEVAEMELKIRARDENLFEEFVDFLKAKQTQIIHQLEELERSEGSSARFSKDAWGMFEERNGSENTTSSSSSGGITRVIQGGNVIEKGACSLTVIAQGILTVDRAATIRARQLVQNDTDDSDTKSLSIQAGDFYSAAALSIVFHSRSPMVPTFRSDIRVFSVRMADDNRVLAWFGGGADLTPYYLFDEDIAFFHEQYRDLCSQYWPSDHPQYSYSAMKKECDSYFYLPARSEHRGTGGIFFDDMTMTETSLHFVEGVADTWMPSWLPIVEKRQKQHYTDEQRQWQLLRRGRYLEFNLLYDRGVKFGLANANPRVEGVMVSAPPLIAFEYNHQVMPDSEEARLVEVLKKPREWV